MPCKMAGWILLAWIGELLIFGVVSISKGNIEFYSVKSILNQTLEYYIQSKHYLSLGLINDLQYLLDKIQKIHSMHSIFNYCAILIIITQIVIARLLIITNFTPLLGLCWASSFIHGLIQRYLRRINGGRESALIYHYAKTGILFFICISAMIYIMLPFYYRPDVILFSGILLSSYSVFVTTKMFKKYS